nr:hypothetical protein [Tanacetum cinerariifolium]
MMKGLDIGEQEKKEKLFNEWEKFTSTDGESIESYYHRFMQLMKDLKSNKYFPENIAANLKFLNNLQPEWKRHDKVNELKAECLAKTHDPLALMAHSQNSYNFPATQKDQSSSSTHSQQSSPINDKYNPQSSWNHNFMQLQITSIEDINDPTEIAQPGMNMSQDRQSQNVKGNGGNQFGQYAGQVAQNQQGYNAWQNDEIQVAQNAVQNAGLRLLDMRIKPEEFDFMAAAGDLDEIEEVNANCILMENLQHASISGPQLDKAPVYDTDGSDKDDKFLDKEVDLEAKIKDLENILLKRDQIVQTMLMLNPKPNSFHHLDQKMALCYPNPSYIKKAQLKQSLYNGNMLLEEHDPPAVYDSKETLELAQES